MTLKYLRRLNSTINIPKATINDNYRPLYANKRLWTTKNNHQSTLSDLIILLDNRINVQLIQLIKLIK